MLMHKEMEDLTRKLVSIPSVNSTAGEHDIAIFIEKYLRKIPYFEAHPDYVFSIPLKNDPLDRRNVFALLKGNGNSSNTLIFHGHTDTVGVEDFGTLKPFAFDCEKMAEALKETDLPSEIRKDLESENYLFGRGCCDMKSGDAVFLVLLKYLSMNPERLKGNILVSFNPVEENLHTGIIEALDFFLSLREKENLNYLMALNNDYICPLYPGDTHRYLYTGTVGKILPCFYIQGKETHVGQCFEGFDAIQIASELIKILHLNPDFCDEYKNEFTLPPSVLHNKDLKDFYNVQTAQENFTYFNYFLHNASMETVMEKLKDASKDALKNCEAAINMNYQKFCSVTGTRYEPYHYPCQVYEYSELFDMACSEYCGDLKQDIKAMAQKELEAHVDLREISSHIVKYLLNMLNMHDPTIIICLAPPYCPHNTLKEEIPFENILLKQLTALSEEYGKEVNEEFQVLQFFPSLSDSSYLKIDDSKASIQTLTANFPAFEVLYPLPLNKILSLNLPAVNLGCYGKDAHKWSERVEKKYSFEILPGLIQKIVDYYLT